MRIPRVLPNLLAAISGLLLLVSSTPAVRATTARLREHPAPVPPAAATASDTTTDTTTAATPAEPVTPAPAETTAPAASDSQERDDREDQVTYDPHGRRDPFRPLTGEVAGEGDRVKYQGTLRGLLWTEVKLTSIMKTPKGPVATFEGGPKKMGYFAREGDRFWNAVVHAIDYGTATVTIREELSDPKLLKPWRDHPISLFPLEQQGAGSAAGGTE